MNKLNILFSPEDEDLAGLNWYLHTAGYANRSIWVNNKSTRVYAHRVVLERAIERSLNKGEITDHINRDKLDNRRENLRVADKSLNTINRDLRPDNKSGYVGVYQYWPKEYRERGWGKRWYAVVGRKGRPTFTSRYFKTALEAHLARENYLKEL